MTQSCFAGAIEGRFKWSGNDVQAKEQWLDLSTFDNHWEAGTFVSEGPMRGITNAYSWPGLDPDTIYYFRVTQQLRDGTWEASGTFTAQTTSCANSAGIRLALDPPLGGSRATIDALSKALGPTTAPPGRIVGFSTKPVKDPAELTPSGGTLGGCFDGLVYAVIQVPAPSVGSSFLSNVKGEWTRDGKKPFLADLASQSSLALFYGLNGISNGSVIRLSTFSFDVDPSSNERIKSAPGVYAVRYGTGSNAIEGSVTLAC